MMNKYLGFALCAFLFFGCGFSNEADQADKVVQQFFKAVIKGDYEGAEPLMQWTVSKEEALLALQGFGEGQEFGKLKKVEKQWGFKTEFKNATTIVTLNYTLTFSKEKVNREVRCQKIGKEYKIIAIN